MTRSALVVKLKEGGEFKTFWKYTEVPAIIKDITDNILAGKGRVVTQRRSGRSVSAVEDIGARIEVPGIWYTAEAYPHGDAKINQHKVVTKSDPLTKKKRKLIFVPKHAPGIYEGSLYSDSRMEDRALVDDDAMLLRGDAQMDDARSQGFSRAGLVNGPLGTSSAELLKNVDQESGAEEEDDQGDDGASVVETLACAGVDAGDSEDEDAAYKKHIEAMENPHPITPIKVKKHKGPASSPAPTPVPPVPAALCTSAASAAALSMHASGGSEQALQKMFHLSKVKPEWQKLLTLTAPELQCDAVVLSRARPPVQNVMTLIQTMTAQAAGNFVKDQSIKSATTSAKKFDVVLDRRGMTGFKAMIGSKQTFANSLQ